MKPAKPGAENHNRRTKKLDHIFEDLKKNNEHWNERYPITEDDQVIGWCDYRVCDRLSDIKRKYIENHGKKMPKNATPVKEAVVVIKEDTTMEQLKKACDRCHARWGINAYEIDMHKDEGHIAPDGSRKLNLHAHIMFDWTNEWGETYKLNRWDMAEMQDIFAEELEMERGKSSNKKHLDAIQQKLHAEINRLAEIEALKMLTKERLQLLPKFLSELFRLIEQRKGDHELEDIFQQYSPIDLLTFYDFKEQIKKDTKKAAASKEEKNKPAPAKNPMKL